MRVTPLVKLAMVVSLAMMLVPAGLALRSAPAPAEASAAAEFRLEEATIADITAAFNSGALTCQRLAQMYLDRIAAYDADLHSIITINPTVMQTAAALDQERQTRGPRGPLHYIPIVLKDNFDTADMPTSNGSVIMKDASYNTVVGYPVNPYHRLRDTGASSSGSGAAVAANFATLGVGTDTSTSVRGPSASNGIVGIRPTTGLISRAGGAPKNLTSDSPGPMARTVTDMALLLNAIAVPDPEDADNLSMWLYNQYPEAVGRDYTQSLQRGALRGARLGIVRDYFGGDPEVDALAEAAIQQMRELGAVIVDGVHLDPEVITTFQEVRRIADYRFRPDWEEYLATFGPEVPKTVQEFVDIYDNEVAHSALPAADSVVNLLRVSLTTSPDDPVHINLIQNTLPEHLALKLAVFDAHGVDALVFPYSPTFASPINNPVYVAEDPSFVSSTVLSPATVAGYGAMGLPGIVVPIGFGTVGLPGAISFMGRPMDEPKIIGYAFDYEQATMHRRPSPLVPPLPNETITY